jgi:hypothetical protein
LQRGPSSDPVYGFSSDNDLLAADQIAFSTVLKWNDGSLQQQMAICEDWTPQTVNQALFEDLLGGSSYR